MSHSELNHSLLNVDRIASTRSMLKARFPDLVERFFTESQMLMDQLLEALSASLPMTAEEAEGVIRLAHSLKSTCRSFGLDEAGRVADQVEKNLTLGHLDTVFADSQTLYSIYTDSCKALKKLLRESGVAI